MEEKEKMLAGGWYNANYDRALSEEKVRAQKLCHEFNQMEPGNEKEKQKIIVELLGYIPENVNISTPFMVDYGYNVKFGKNVFININSYFMDGAEITIGDNVFVGPSCGFYTAEHPLDADERRKGLEKASPITVGDDVWIGAGVSVMPGAAIGDKCVIGAGSVVTKDIPPNSLAMGVPCHVIREID